MQRPGLDSENEMKSRRDAECCSGDPVQSLLVCVWGGAAVKSIEALGGGVCNKHALPHCTHMQDPHMLSQALSLHVCWCTLGNNLSLSLTNTHTHYYISILLPHLSLTFYLKAV